MAPIIWTKAVLPLPSLQFLRGAALMRQKSQLMKMRDDWLIHHLVGTTLNPSKTAQLPLRFTPLLLNPFNKKAQRFQNKDFFPLLTRICLSWKFKNEPKMNKYGRNSYLKFIMHSKTVLSGSLSIYHRTNHFETMFILLYLSFSLFKSSKLCHWTSCISLQYLGGPYLLFGIHSLLVASLSIVGDYK